MTMPLFLEPHIIADSAADLGLQARSLAELHAIAGTIVAEPALLEAVSALQHCVFDTDDPLDAMVARADALLGEKADAMHALLVLESTRLVRDRQGARGVPIEQSRAVNDRHGAAWLREAEQRGSMAIHDWIPGWLRLVASGNLYRLGRLEFVPCPFEQPFRAYRNTAGDVVMLAHSGIGFTDEGYMIGPHTWTSVLQESAEAIVGTPILPSGRAQRRPVSLPRTAWRQVLGPGDDVLDMHIPSEGALTLAAIAEALAQTGPFFERFEPGRRFAAFTCWSWLFSPQLEMLLGADSNIVRWQRSGYLLPNDSGAEDFLTFTFGAPAIDPATAPRDTRLRRAVISFLEQGGTLLCGSYVLLADDRDVFAAQPYRQRSAQAIARLSMLSGRRT